MAPTLTAAAANAMRWDGEPGHYEVWYLSATDPAGGVGLWIRYTMVAPLMGGPPATCSLWFMAMDPENPAANVGRKISFPAADLHAEADPFRLRISDAELTDNGMRGAFEDVAWDLSWTPTLPPAAHVHPFLERAKIAKTVLVLPHPDLAVSGSVTMPDRTLKLDGVRGGQAHLWGSKHALRWAWIHCNDLATEDGDPRPGDFIDGVSVFVPRFGREIGPNTPIVGRFGGRDFASTGPVRVVRNPSHFALTTWEFEAIDGDQRIVGQVDAAPRRPRRRHLPRPRRRPRVLLQQRGGLPPPPALRARQERLPRLAPDRRARGAGARALRVRPARARGGARAARPVTLAAPFRAARGAHRRRAPGRRRPVHHAPRRRLARAV